MDHFVWAPKSYLCFMFSIIFHPAFIISHLFLTLNEGSFISRPLYWLPQVRIPRIPRHVWPIVTCFEASESPVTSHLLYVSVWGVLKLGSDQSLCTLSHTNTWTHGWWSLVKFICHYRWFHDICGHNQRISKERIELI